MKAIIAITIMLSTFVTDVDVAKTTGIHPDVLEGALQYELVDSAYTFVEAEMLYGVNAVALASIAALESDWGRSELAQTKHNLFGWRTSDGGYMEFYNNDECILYIAKKISENYLDENGSYYQGGTMIEDISSIYSEAEDWSEKIESIYNQILESCNGKEL